MIRMQRKNIRTGVRRHMLELDALPVRDIDFDGYITLNGQLCLDDRRSVIGGTPITGTDKERIIGLFEGKEIPLVLVEKDATYINFANRQVEQTQKEISTKVPALGSYTGNEIYQAVAYVEKEEGENDIEMLTFTEIGIAMGNADETVKRCADHVAPGVDEDGIEKALKYFGVIR